MKATSISILIAAVLIGGAIIFAAGGNRSENPAQKEEEPANNVSIVEGKQIIDIRARGGYSPRITTAKADMPTALKMETQGTFDCSLALVIPSLNYSKNLPPSGETIIDIPPQKAGTTIRGLCAMGMYSFVVNFE